MLAKWSQLSADILDKIEQSPHVSFTEQLLMSIVIERFRNARFDSNVPFGIK